MGGGLGAIFGDGLASQIRNTEYLISRGGSLSDPDTLPLLRRAAELRAQESRP